jgi:pilus assembly protein TadC
MAEVAASVAFTAVVLGARRLRPVPDRIRGGRPGRSRVLRGARRNAAGRSATVIVCVISVVVGLTVWPPLVGVGGVLAVAVPRLRRARARRRRNVLIRRGLPDVVDLLGVAVASGLTPRQAVERLGALAAPPFDVAFSDVNRRANAGERLADALSALIDQLGPIAHPIVAAITATDRYGLALGPALELLAHDARRERRRLADESARTLPVKLCFPLVCCILPAFGFLTVAPLVAGALTSLRL